jgi:circadian clock protein KaiC
MSSTTTMYPKCSSGVPGLDHVLGGGLPKECCYLIEGAPGVGKTTLAMQFLLEGTRNGERCLYVTLSETKRELAMVAESHGWDLSGIVTIELSAIEQAISPKGMNTLFQPAEVELNHMVRLLVAEIERIKPTRVVLDSLSELRLLSQSPLRYRREVLGIKQHLARMGCTAMLLDDRSFEGSDVQVHSIVHGAITLSAALLKYGIFRRTLAVRKLRGVQFREGNHDYIIEPGGLRVFARLIASEHDVVTDRRLASSGNATLDAMLGGGLHHGTSNLLIGPAGSGKSTMASMFAVASAARGERVNYYLFDETKANLCERAVGMGLPVMSHIESGMLQVHQMDPAEISPGELAAKIRQAVEQDGAKVIVLDSLNGYVTAMPEEEYLHLHLHELLSYLNQRGVMTVMIMAQHGLLGPMGAPIDVSYLADSVVLTRFFEAAGSIRKAVSIIKKRSGTHEDSVREFSMQESVIRIGEPLRQFQGILTGVPVLLGHKSG